jgi:hypothetical protein
MKKRGIGLTKDAKFVIVVSISVFVLIIAGTTICQWLGLLGS